MTQTDASGVHVEIENVGGIDALEETVAPGVTVLSGENATNRTSFLRALATGLGGREARAKTDSSAPGLVRIAVDGQTYERTVTGTGDSPAFEGEGYLAPERVRAVKPFAWLFADNAVRRALRSGGDLHEIAMRPVDTDELERRERELTDRRADLEERRAELEAEEERLPAVEAEVRDLESEVESLEAELAEKRAELERTDRSVDVAEEKQSDREAALADKEAAESERRRLERDVEAEREAIDALETQLEDAEAALEEARRERAELDVDPERVEAEITRLERERIQADDVQSALRTVISFNLDVLDDGKDQLWRLLEEHDDGDGAVTDRLVEAEDAEVVECWTCGATTDAEEISGQVSRLREQLESLSTREAELADRIDDLRERRGRYEDVERRVEELSAEVARLERKLDDRRGDLERTRDDLAAATDRLEAAEAELDEFEAGSEDDVLAISREVSELEVELSDATDRLEELRAERESLAAAADEIDDVEAEIEVVADELADVRTMIRTREEAIVEEFNDAMDDLVEILAYRNVERVWLTRHRRDSAGTDDVEFRLNVVRQTDDGAAVEDSVENLSESEREVVAVAFALAGYVAHDVAEDMPFLLFDSVEMIDAERLDRLFEYFADRADYLVAALLSEDARVVEGPHTTQIDFGEPVSADRAG